MDDGLRVGVFQHHLERADEELRGLWTSAMETRRARSPRLTVCTWTSDRPIIPR
ncbi:hypothetical protein ACN28S_46735 [Cystobacter fuscus]